MQRNTLNFSVAEWTLTSFPLMKRLDPDVLPLSLSQLQTKVKEPLFPPSVFFFSGRTIKTSCWGLDQIDRSEQHNAD